MSTAHLERNLSLYPWYQAAGGFLPWLPVFFLFFFQHVSLPDALRLGAIYYFSVFLLEVPSGYFSDRFGRRITLLLSSCFAVVAYLLFIISDSFNGLALGQFILAGFFSFKSGSDNSLLFDSLSILGRESEYAAREANGVRFSMFALAASALIGGITGVIDLSIPYYLAVAGASVTLIICIFFSEPASEEQQRAEPFFRQLGICFASLKQPQLLWLFSFSVFAYSLVHIPAEFNQPYVKLLQLSWFGSTDASALVSGVMVAISMLGGALGATISMRLLARYGVEPLLIGGLGIMVLLILGMSSILHPAVLSVVLFRNFPMAFSEAPLLSAIAPRIKSSYRATYLSMQSLMGRLGFSLVLVSLSTVVDSQSSSGNLAWPELQTALRIALAMGVVGLAALIYFRPAQLRKS